MAVYLAWSPSAVPHDVLGPWSEVRAIGDGLALVESDAGLSRVYHELKWALPEGTALFVAPLPERPKLKGLPAGTTTWLRDRIAGPDQ
ncbi:MULTISPECIES: hypothetical protein [unclassified Nocardioides]|uniref:hypothetical protein n=1 Tax=unclassified Nocardioides TaxID=2615069 RepID=UPI0011547513|nr:MULTISPECIES: hypothetical protein [unclassified Nocardioides]TQK71741.1 hypothetical protein FBY23_3540 [Nocardioides sp. SLBN-35]WGY04077.1 hypothetical protein QI633_09985 [Nocardioides sp. QY071]